VGAKRKHASQTHQGKTLVPKGQSHLMNRKEFLMAVWKDKNKLRAEVYGGRRRIACKSGFERRKDAQIWHDAIAMQYRTKPEDFEQVESMTFDELLELFKNLHLPTIRLSTQERYMIDIRHRILPFFGGMKLDRITSSMIEAFKIDIMRRLNPKSVNHTLFLLKLMFSKAVEWGLMKITPSKVKPLKIANSGRLEWWDDKDYIRRFLTEAKRSSRYYPAYLLALETGMRLGEICGLSKRDIDFHRGRIHVWRQWSDKYNSYGPPKHGTDRWIDFIPDGHLADVLRKTVAESPHPEAIFVTSNGQRVLNRKLAGDHFQEVIRKAGVPKICFHSLRHTFASWYMIAFDDIWALKNILGHQDVRTTHRYAHHSSRHQRKPLELYQLSGFLPKTSHLRVVGQNVGGR
jgi:integrase